MSAIAAALVGAAATALLSALISYVNYRHTRKRLLEAAALRCLDRLRKIELAAGTPLPANDDAIETLSERQQKTVQNELGLLGDDGDRYLDRIAAAWPYERSRHLPLYRQLSPIFVMHDLRPIPELAPKLEAFTLEMNRFGRSWARIVGYLRSLGSPEAGQVR